MSTTFLARSKTTLPTAEHTDTPAAPAVVGSATSATVATEPSALRRVVSALGVLGPGGTIAAAILLVVAIAAIWPSLLTSTDPLAANPLNTLQPPSAEHIAGTDSLGRDVLTRIIYGARYSLTIGIGATALAVTAGVLLGLVAGVGNKFVDGVIARAIDVLASFPEILLALVLIAFTGPGLGNLIVAIGIAGIPRFARVVRAQTQLVRHSGYVEQSRTFGLSWGRLVARHVLPNSLATIPVLATIGLGGAIIGAAGLSFLGLGPQPPTPEWGAMLAENRDYLRVAWWGAVFPGIAVVLTVVSSTVLGRALQARFERAAA